MYSFVVHSVQKTVLVSLSSQLTWWAILPLECFSFYLANFCIRFIMRIIADIVCFAGFSFVSIQWFPQLCVHLLRKRHKYILPIFIYMWLCLFIYIIILLLVSAWICVPNRISHCHTRFYLSLSLSLILRLFISHSAIRLVFRTIPFFPIHCLIVIPRRAVKQFYNRQLNIAFLYTKNFLLNITQSAF